MIRWFALTLLAVLLATALPPSPGAAQTGAQVGAPAPATTAAASDAPTASDAAQVEADTEDKAKADKAKQDELNVAKTPDVGKMATLLAGVFALAAIIEAALAVIFTWPIFLDRINRRNSKMPIALLVCWVVAWGFELELVHKLAAAFGAGSGKNLPDGLDPFLSGLILAGGAASVRNLMVSLGLATPTAEIEKPPRPPSNKAWLSVTDGRDHWDRHKPLTIWLGQAATATNPAKFVIAGVIPADTKPPSKFRHAFLTDKSRFPVVAGHPLPSGQTFDIYVQPGATIPVPGSATWTGFTFGEGAIIDLVYRSPPSQPTP